MTSQTTTPVGIYWKPGVWDLARSAYVADLDTDPDSPGSFAGWIAQALEVHARRSPRQRAEIAAGGETHPALVSVTRKSFNKKHDLPVSITEAVEFALVADRQELGRVLARSAFAQEAVIAAAEEARLAAGPRPAAATAEAQQPTAATPRASRSPASTSGSELVRPR